MPLKQVHISSLEQFICKVRNFRDDWDELELWFRGAQYAKWPLRPSLYRDLKTERIARKKEDECRIEFSRRGHPHAKEIPKSDLDWYILMRHNEVPTRLLDWTEGALIALYFAVRIHDPQYHELKNKDAVVWILDPQWLNKTFHEKSELIVPTDSEIKKYLPPPREKKSYGLPPLAFIPPYLIPQMQTQRSAFTIQGTPDMSQLIAAQSRKKRLAKIIVRHSAINKIRDDLAICGITEATIFPGLTGTGRETWEFYL